jgi:hypothetical protein
MQNCQSAHNLRNDDFDRGRFQLLRRRSFPKTRNIGAQHWQDEAKVLSVRSLDGKVVIETREIDGKGTAECPDCLHNFQFE